LLIQELVKTLVGLQSLNELFLCCFSFLNHGGKGLDERRCQALILILNSVSDQRLELLEWSLEENLFEVEHLAQFLLGRRSLLEIMTQRVRREQLTKQTEVALPQVLVFLELLASQLQPANLLGDVLFVSIQSLFQFVVALVGMD